MQPLLSRYKPAYLTTLVYMLQSTEYQPGPYLKWYAKTNDFTDVMYRRRLEPTRPAQMLLKALRLGTLGYLVITIGLAVVGWLAQSIPLVFIGLILAGLYPFVWAYLIVVPLIIGKHFIIEPRHRQQVAAAEPIFAQAKATKIAIAGSYGKTTMKEILLTVLSEAKKVAATPANKNVAISHAQFAQSLKGDEEVLIIEYGESKPGDIAAFTKMTHPDIGIITGLAPAHLDQYKTVEAAGHDIMQLAAYLKNKNVYISGESQSLQPLITPELSVYTQQQVGDWKISQIKTALDGITFTMRRKNQTMHLASGLLGRHQVAPLALAAALGRELGLEKADVERGVAKTRPFEHRMQPRVVAGANIIDDTYNGNLEGIRAGLALLAELPAKRKIYVTPGLVDQGDQAEPVHIKIGHLIAAAKPDIVVLMQNSATNFIQIGLEEKAYAGKILIETDPLAFYTDLTSTTAAGDLVLMQNDWTDNYK